MLITPRNAKINDGYFTFGKELSAAAHPSLHAPIFAELWQGYTLRSSEIRLTEVDELSFTAGNAFPIAHGDADYALSVTEGGISLSSGTREGLARGFITLIERIEQTEGGFRIGCCEIADSPNLSLRMVHICIFPETDLLLFRRTVRLCGMLKYSHIILEFWGMLKLDCLKELAWDI